MAGYTKSNGPTITDPITSKVPGVPNVITLIKEMQKEMQEETIPTTPPKESPPMDQETIFKESIPRLIEIVETLNPPEKVKIIGKLRGALELFNSTN